MIWPKHERALFPRWRCHMRAVALAFVGEVAAAVFSRVTTPLQICLSDSR